MSYLSELRLRFIETLNLSDEEIIIPDEAHLLVAKGAALDSLHNEPISNEVLKEKIKNLRNSNDTTTHPIEPLFDSEQDYNDFKSRHAISKVVRKDISNYEGDCFLGIDAGSTTTNIVLIDNEGNLYGSNQGNPLKSVMNMLKKMYEVVPPNAILRFSGVTGYGEKLIQTALNVDLNEIETIAHYTAALSFEPNVTSIIDIGGQDMKYIKLKNGAMDNMMLNEACSSGCRFFY